MENKISNNRLSLGLKYCGGCNIHFDRKTLVEAIREQFGSKMDIDYVSSGGEFDLILVLNACPVACASIDQLEAKQDIYIVRTKKDCAPDGPVISWIQSFLDA